MLAKIIFLCLSTISIFIGLIFENEAYNQFNSLHHKSDGAVASALGTSFLLIGFLVLITTIIEIKKNKNMGKRILKNVLNLLIPISTVWLIIIYFRMLGNFSTALGPWILHLLFIPVIISEIFYDSLILRKQPLKIWARNKKAITLLLGKLFFWYTIFLLWIVILPGLNYKHQKVLLYGINSWVWNLIPPVYVAESYLTLAALLLWMFLYYFFTVKRRRLRIVTSIIIPFIFTFLLYYHYYYLGGIGNPSVGSIMKQTGVSIFYGKDNFPKKDYFDHNKWTKICKLYPRDLYYDANENALYSNYCSSEDDTLRKMPTLLRIDMDTKDTKYFVGRYVKVFGINNSSLLVAPAQEARIYELDRNNLSIIRTFKSQVDLGYWKVLDIYHDLKRRCVYLSTDVDVGLYKYNFKTGKLLDSIIPEFIDYGGGMINMTMSKKTNMIYILGYYSDYDIMEIDPEIFEIKRKLSLNTYNLFSLGSSCLILDDEAGLLYVQHSLNNKLYEIDLESFKVQKIVKGEKHARRMLIDKKRNTIYQTGYLSGKLTAVDIKSGKRMWTLKVGGKPYGLELHNDKLYINSMAGIIEIDLNTVWNERHAE
jgi:hypothetical protein